MLTSGVAILSVDVRRCLFVAGPLLCVESDSTCEPGPPAPIAPPSPAFSLVPDRHNAQVNPLEPVIETPTASGSVDVEKRSEQCWRYEAIAKPDRIAHQRENGNDYRT